MIGKEVFDSVLRHLEGQLSIHVQHFNLSLAIEPLIVNKNRFSLGVKRF